MAWHGLFVLLWKGHFRCHAVIIPKQLWFAREILKNLFPSPDLRGDSGFAAVLDPGSIQNTLAATWTPFEPFGAFGGDSPAHGRDFVTFKFFLARMAYNAPGLTPATNEPPGAEVRQEHGKAQSDAPPEHWIRRLAGRWADGRQTQLVTLWLLYEHRFGKDGKSHKAHKSAHLEIG